MTPSRSSSPKKSNKSKTNPARVPVATPVVNPSSDSEQPDFIVERLFRRRSISLISGPPYAGKTTLMFQIIRDWKSPEGSVFGYTAYPESACYLSTIHNQSEATDVMNRVGADIKVLSTITSKRDEKLTFEYVCDQAKSELPKGGVIFLDGIHPLCSNSNDPGVVTNTIGNIIRVLDERNITLVAAGCSSKPKDHYSSTKDRFAGAYSWLQGSSAFISIDFSRPDEPKDPRRSVVLHSKYGVAEKMSMRFSGQGALVIFNPKIDPFGRFKDFDTVLFARPAGTEVEMAEMSQIGENTNVSISTVKRHLDDLENDGYIKKIRWGVYVLLREQ